MDIDKIINIVKSLREQAVMGAPTNAVGTGQIAGTKEEFEVDLKRIKYVKRLLKRYKNTGVLKTHLILNHLTVLFNVFGEAAVPLLFYNLEEDLWPAIKSFLMFLRRIPEYPKSHIHGIPEDETCIKELNSV